MYYKQISLILHEYKLNQTRLAKQLGVYALDRAISNAFQFLFSVYSHVNCLKNFSETVSLNLP